MNADRVGIVRERADVGNGGSGIGDQSAGEMAGAEGTVGLIGAVGEDFAGGAAAGGSEDFQHRRAAEAIEDEVRVVARAFEDGVGEGGVARGVVVEGAVGLEVGEGEAEVAGELSEGVDLCGDGGREGFGREVHREAAEVLAVRIAGVGTGSDAVSAALQ